MLSPLNIDTIIYHHPCPDGCTSATIANKFFKEIGKEVNFWGISHSANSPPELYEKLKNKNVLICDFSFKKDIINNLLKIVKGLLIIDHHKSAKEDLENLDQKYKIFDMNHCGAYLVWNYFYPEKTIPLFVKYIEDNDIWLKAMPQTLEVTAYVSSLELDFDIFEKFINDETLIHKEAIPLGEILLKQAQKQIDFSLKKASVKMTEFDDMIYFVGSCNSTTNINEVGNNMLTKFPYINFSCTFSLNANKSYSASLRSDDSRTDVSIVASKNYGGGHRNASGCVLYNGKFVPGNEIGDYNSYYQLEDVDYFLNNDYNYVMLNTSTNKTQFAQYLLQTRTTEIYEENTREVQEACSIYRIIQKDPNFYAKFDFSITWHYGGGKTWYQLHWHNDAKDKIESLLKKISKYDNYNIIEKKRMAKFSLPKLNLNFF
jgi:oligoribonuclease NrnB/cAMP/cGMP phosphodiesterase (DHH superfamily)